MAKTSLNTAARVFIGGFCVCAINIKISYDSYNLKNLNTFFITKTKNKIQSIFVEPGNVNAASKCDYV